VLNLNLSSLLFVSSMGSLGNLLNTMTDSVGPNRINPLLIIIFVKKKKKKLLSNAIEPVQ
jgi:hypothetical protein